MLERIVSFTPIAYAYRTLAVRLFDFTLARDHQSTRDRGIITSTTSPGTQPGASTSRRMSTLPRAYAR